MPVQKEDVGCALSEVYLKAISFVAGYPFQLSNRSFDKEGIDAKLDVNKFFGVNALNAFDLNVQLKHTSSPEFLQNGDISHRLEVPTYNRYRETNTSNMYISVLLVLPNGVDVKKWITSTPKQLCIKGTAYYASIYGKPIATGSSKIAVHYKKKNRLSIDKLENIIKMFAIGDVVKI